MSSASSGQRKIHIQLGPLIFLVTMWEELPAEYISIELALRRVYNFKRSGQLMKFELIDGEI